MTTTTLNIIFNIIDYLEITQCYIYVLYISYFTKCQISCLDIVKH